MISVILMGNEGHQVPQNSEPVLLELETSQEKLYAIASYSQDTMTILWKVNEDFVLPDSWSTCEKLKWFYFNNRSLSSLPTLS